MKRMEKINLLKKADMLNEEEMKLLVGGENEACGGGFQLYSCSWNIKGASSKHAWVCATSLNEAEKNLRKTIYSQLGEVDNTCCADYR